MKFARCSFAAFVVLAAIFLASIAWPRSTGTEPGEALPETPVPAGTTAATVRSGQGWSALPTHQAVGEAVQALPPPTAPPVTVPPTLPPAPPTTAPPAPVELAPAQTIERSDIEALICSYGWDCATALRVFWCESKHQPGAVSPGGGNLGIAQVNTVHRARWQAMGYSQADMLHAGPNLAVAHSIWAEQGWQPWSCR